VSDDEIKSADDGHPVQTDRGRETAGIGATILGPVACREAWRW